MNRNRPYMFFNLTSQNYRPEFTPQRHRCESLLQHLLAQRSMLGRHDLLARRGPVTRVHLVSQKLGEHDSKLEEIFDGQCDVRELPLGDDVVFYLVFVIGRTFQRQKHFEKILWRINWSIVGQIDLEVAELVPLVRQFFLFRLCP